MPDHTTQNPGVRKAVTVIRELSADEKIREEARKREEALFNERSALYAERKAAKAEGRAEGREDMIRAFRYLGFSEEAITEAVKLAQKDYTLGNTAQQSQAEPRT